MPQTTAVSSASAIVRPPERAKPAMRSGAVVAHAGHQHPNQEARAEYAPLRSTPAGRCSDARDSRRRQGAESDADRRRGVEITTVARRRGRYRRGRARATVGRDDLASRAIAQRPSRRRASAPVKLAGMCCAMTMGHGKLDGNARQQRLQRRRPAGRGCRPPPVRRPSPARRLRPGAADARAARRAPADLVAERVRAGEGSPSACAPAAARTFATNSGPNTSMCKETAPSGLVTKSTAPRRSASSVASAPSRVSDETISTGQGCSIMIRSRQARPSMLRHMDVERDDIGTDSGELLQPFHSVAREMRPRSPATSARTRPNSLRIRAELSITRTLIMKAPALRLRICRAGRARFASAARPDPTGE